MFDTERFLKFCLHVLRDLLITIHCVSNSPQQRREGGGGDSKLQLSTSEAIEGLAPEGDFCKASANQDPRPEKAAAGEGRCDKTRQQNYPSIHSWAIQDPGPLLICARNILPPPPISAVMLICCCLVFNAYFLEDGIYISQNHIHPLVIVIRVTNRDSSLCRAYSRLSFLQL